MNLQEAGDFKYATGWPGATLGAGLPCNSYCPPRHASMRQSMCGNPYRPPCHASMRQSMCGVCVCVCARVCGRLSAVRSIGRSVGLSPGSSVGVRLCVQLRAHECVRACAHISPQMRSVRCMRAGAYRRLHPHVCGHVRMCVFVCSPSCLRTCACIMFLLLS